MGRQVPPAMKPVPSAHPSARALGLSPAIVAGERAAPVQGSRTGRIGTGITYWTGSSDRLCPVQEEAASALLVMEHFIGLVHSTRSFTLPQASAEMITVAGGIGLSDGRPED
jgi:hypothetical protein